MLKELGKIFGSENRVKLMRFFLANQENQISFLDLIKKVKISKNDLKKEIKNLINIDFVNELILTEEIEVKVKAKKSKKGKVQDLPKTILKQVKEEGYELNKNYVFVDSLASLLLDFRYINRVELLEDLKKYGKIKLLCLGGVFFRDKEGNLDLLIAGDAMDKEKIDSYIKKMEAEYGTELRYAVFESEEFRYRVSMFDRLLKDFWKRPHEKVIEKISTRP